MKSKMLAIVCVAAVSLLGSTPARAAGERTDPAAVGTDALLGRPLCLAATILGSALWVVSLPVELTSGSVRTSAEALVLKPARATFVRPLGDFSYPHEASKDDMAKMNAKKAKG